MNINQKAITVFQHKVLSWYEKEQRDLPWRKTTNPYHILISEVMLQQTQVDRVIAYYERWLKELPSWKALAQIDTKTLLSLWSGLGYNNRALRLQKLAREVIEKYQGILPADEARLLGLPGIGPYTARAVLAFAFNKEVPVVDTNIRRVLIHELHINEDIPIKDLEKIALQAVPKGKSCIWHNALMDYGATVLTAKKTGIKPLSKQSKFKGSDREVRGFIVKALVDSQELSIESLKSKFKNKNIHDILAGMERDGVIKKDQKNVFLQ